MYCVQYCLSSNDANIFSILHSQAADAQSYDLNVCDVMTEAKK